MTVQALNPAPPRDAQSLRAPPLLRPTRLTDYARIRRLEASHGLLTLSEHDWRAMWLNNPLRPRIGEDFAMGWALEEADGRIVGSLANVPTLYTLGGRELIAVTGRAWVVEPEYRGVALWLMDEYFNQGGVDLFINTTVNGQAVDAFTSFGSARAPVGDWSCAAFGVTQYRGFVRCALRLKKIPLAGLLSVPGGAVLNLRDRLSRRASRAPDAGAQVECIHTFDARFDGFWQEMTRLRGERLLCRRDSRTLTWHFAGPIRAGELWVITASRGNLLRAYGIFKRQDHPQSGLRRVRMVDFQSLDESVDYLPALAAAAARLCSQARVHVLEHVGCGLAKMAAFDTWANYRRKLPAWPFYYQAADPELHARLGDASLWDPSAYDGDASI